MSDFIYHIVEPNYFETFNGKALYFPESLAEEGFIHCSMENQIEGVIERYYAEKKQLIILKLDTNKLTAPVKFEKSTNDELYPHIYGKINLDAVVKIIEFSKVSVNSEDTQS
ncbi:MAG: DUF952 domain-containing protein [Bacteroidota bacterium]